MENADIILRKLHNNEIDDVPIEEGNIIFDKDTKQMLVDDEDNGVGKRLKYGGSEKLIDVILTANTTTKTIYDDTITTDSIIRVYVDEDDSFTYNSISTASGSVTITFNAMTQDVPIKIGIGAVSEFHQLITEGQASDISYNNSQSGMTATDVQEAIDELKSDLGNIELTADNVEYDNTTSGLQATNVQGAVDEINDNLAGFKFYPTGTQLVAYIEGHGWYNADGKYVIWGTATANALVEASPNTYYGRQSEEDLRGEVGADTAIPFSGGAKEIGHSIVMWGWGSGIGNFTLITISNVVSNITKTRRTTARNETVEGEYFSISLDTSYNLTVVCKKACNIKVYRASGNTENTENTTTTPIVDGSFNANDIVISNTGESNTNGKPYMIYAY
jgi:hypothetical protein